MTRYSKQSSIILQHGHLTIASICMYPSAFVGHFMKNKEVFDERILFFTSWYKTVQSSVINSVLHDLIYISHGYFMV